MSLSDEIALACVVTAGVMEEFELMKFSFELFHGCEFHWFLRCDQSVANRLGGAHRVHCEIFEAPNGHRADAGSPAFKKIVYQKMEAIEFAWRTRDWPAVAFMDADLVVTSQFLPEIITLPGQVLLSPHFYHPSRKENDEPEFGKYNSGFVLTRVRNFSAWWRKAFAADEAKFSDQNCFESAGAVFDISDLTEAANYGFWRGQGSFGFTLPPVPENCQFLHVHFFQPNTTSSDLVRDAFVNELMFRLGRRDFRFLFDSVHITHKTTALHCLAFLASSADPRRRRLCEEILRRDRLSLYSALLKPAGNDEREAVAS